MIFCKNCILPNTRPNLIFDRNGLCSACLQHKEKKEIDWTYREKLFKNFILKSKKNHNYDCIVPVSGGKDSTWQIVKCLEYDLKPLAITWKSPSRTKIGQENLDNLIRLGVDHIDYQINPKVEAKFMYEAFKKFGSTAIPMHLAIHNIPVKFALKFKIPLIIWGEDSSIEYGNNEKIDNKIQTLNKNWFKKYGVTNETTADNWISKKLSKKDLTPYYGINWNDLNTQNIKSLFLGNFFQWDIDNSFKIAKKHGFKSDNKVKIGYYKHTDIDCNFISIHHWMKWYKFGFTRTMDNLSIEIRNDRITRKKAINIIKKEGINTPRSDIKILCKFLGINENKFFYIAQRFINKKIFQKKGNKIINPYYLKLINNEIF